MDTYQTTASEHIPPPLSRKIALYIHALLEIPFYRYGEIGNILYAVGKNILDGVILYAMFSMAETELKAAAILGIVVKYTYPGITIVSSTYTSGFIDRLESARREQQQLSRLVAAHIGIGAGQSLGALCLLMCFPPVFKYFFTDANVAFYTIIVLYFLHHVFDGSAQIVEGRTWFKIIEIKIRRGSAADLSANFWVIYTVAQNFQLLLGQLFLWVSLGLAHAFAQHLTTPLVLGVVCSGLFCVIVSKFVLPAAYTLKLCS